MQVWIIGPSCTRNLSPSVRILQRTTRLAGRNGVQSTTTTRKTRPTICGSGSDRSEKCRWYILVDEFMSDRAHVVSHAHAIATNPDGPKSTSASVTATTEPNASENTSKSPEPKSKEKHFLEKYLGRSEDSSKYLMNSLKTSDDMKMTLLMSMQQTMQKLVEKL